jgi:hypothetical protein
MIVRAAPSAVRQFPGMLSAPLNRYSPLWYPAEASEDMVGTNRTMDRHMVRT